MHNMDLFDDLEDSPIGIINYDGIVEYHGILIPYEQANIYFDTLLNEVAWQNDQANILGKNILTKRKVAWYADKPFSYTYSNHTKVALPWNQTLLALKNKVEEATGEHFNACLLNLYHDGDEGMAWHSDAEKDLQKNAAIASLSLGAQRKFSFKHKRNQELISVSLQHGSLLVMKGETQSHWLHRLPPVKNVSSPRINLTFRMINEHSTY